MSKNWYPIIDYEKCVSCFECVNFCPHKVFEIIDDKPVVANPLDCVDFCKGCSKGACPVDAISYYEEEK